MKIRCGVLLITFALTITHFAEVTGRNVSRDKRQSSLTQPKRIVCYYAFWAALRPGQYRFTPQDINPNLCTHIMYAYARLEPGEGIVPYNVKLDIEDGGWRSIVGLKNISSTVKILLSVGGRFEGSSRFTKIAADVNERLVFAQSAINLMRNFGFDGIDLTWLYAGFSEGSSSADRENYVSLVRVLREELTDDYILSMSVPSLRQYIDKGIDVAELLKYVDYLNVLAYDYHDSTDATVNHHGPLYSLPNDPGNKDANVDATIRDYLNRGATPDQLNLVIPLYAVAFSLENPDENGIGAPTEDEGFGLEEAGAVIYVELCQKLRRETWTVKKVNSTALGPYAFKDKSWVAYDDEEMVRNKAKYAVEKGLGGIGFWTVDQDDFKGVCSANNFPLLRAGRDVFLEGDNFIPLPRPTTRIPVPTSKPVEEKPTPRPPKTFVTASSQKPTTSSKKPTIPPTKPLFSRTTLSEPITPSSDEDVIVLNPNKPAQNVVYSSNRDIIFSIIRLYVENNFHKIR